MGQMVQGIARHLLTAAGGAMVAKGVVDAGTAEAAIGALVTLAGVAWSIWEKKAR
jgi:hypothetical protein